MRILLDKILKNIHIDHEKNVKKNQKNSGMAPVPGPKVFFTTIFTLNKPKMAYSRDLPKMARQQCGIMD